MFHFEERSSKKVLFSYLLIPRHSIFVTIGFAIIDPTIQIPTIKIPHPSSAVIGHEYSSGFS
jgi:hypothetical protein